MSITDWIILGLFTSLFVLIAPILGIYIFRVFNNKAKITQLLLGWLERLCYRIGGVNPNTEMNWKQYAKNLFLFNFFGFLFLFILQQLQFFLPINPQHFK